MVKTIVCFLLGIVIGLGVGLYISGDKKEKEVQVVEKVYTDTVKVDNVVRIVKKDTIKVVDTVFVEVAKMGTIRRFFIYDTLLDFINYRLVFDYDLLNDRYIGGLREAIVSNIHLNMLFKDEKLYYSVKPRSLAEILDINFRYEVRDRLYVGGGLAYTGGFSPVGGFGYNFRDKYFLNFDFGYKVVLLSMKIKI